MNGSRRLASVVVLASCILLPQLAFASPASRVARSVMRQAGEEVTEQGVRTMTKRLTALESRYGASALQAVERSGARAIDVIEAAGADGALAARIMAKHGDGAVRLASEPGLRALVRVHGDDAAKAMLEHPGVAESIIRSHGKAGIDALGTLTARNGRRLGMLADDGALAAAGQADEVLKTVVRYGDEGMDFVWRHRWMLGGGAALAMFLSNPEPYIEGTVELVDKVGEHVSAPVTAVGGELAKGVGVGLGWLGMGAAVALVLWMIAWIRRRPAKWEVEGS